MKKFFATFLSTFFLSMVHGQIEHLDPVVKFQPNYLTGEERRAARIYNNVLPTTVEIFTSEIALNSKGLIGTRGALGSGVLISNKSHILTAAHVVQNANIIMVRTQDGNMHDAEVIFTETDADIALVRLKIPDPTLKHAKLGNSDSLVVGQRTYVMGNPYGLANSFSVGRISAFRTKGSLYDGTIPVEYIQTDAAINSGNSGGAVFNSQGEVIGISSQIISVSGGFQGIGLVIAINTAKQVLSLEDRVWMGFKAIYLARDELSILFNVDAEGGLLVQKVTTGGPADLAGLRPGYMPATILEREILLGGDLILQIGEQETCHTQCLLHARERIENLKQIKIVFMRAGQKKEVLIDVSGAQQNFLERD